MEDRDVPQGDTYTLYALLYTLHWVMYTAVEVLSSLAEQLISYSANAIVDWYYEHLLPKQKVYQSYTY